MGANAQTSVPTFTAGDVLTAANMNISARTGVPVFADTTARDAAFGGTGEKTLAEGQLAYLENTNIVQFYDGSNWLTLGPTTSGVIQVKSAVKTDSFTTTSTTFTDLTGLSVSITPTSASNKVLVFYNVAGVGVSGTNMGGLVLVRDSTTILQGDAAGSRSRVASILTEMTGAQITQASNSYLDSPATTSATTYKIQIRTLGAGGTTVYVNRTTTDTDLAAFGRSTSSITVMEVAP